MSKEISVEESKRRVQTQFGDKVEAYATSAVHARGASLERIVELTAPEPDWRVLDVATAAGHTAHALAPHVGQVVATDLTAPMLPKARALAAEKGLDNVAVAAADAEALPFAAESFDLVTCRIAAHHFPEVSHFLAETRRVLRPGGLLAVVDNVVPGSLRQGKKARLQREAGRYVNAYERLRDPSHVRCLSIYEWHEALRESGYALLHEETEWKWMIFGPWAERMGVTEPALTRLRVMLTRAPREVLAFLTPEIQGDTIRFRLSEALFIARLDDV